MPQIVVQVDDENKVKQISDTLRGVDSVSAVNTYPDTIEWRPSRDGDKQPFVQGTRVTVTAVVGYSQAGYTPYEITSEILPHLSLSQVYDALRFYEQNQAQMDALIQANSPAAWRQKLVDEMGREAAARLLGEVDDR